MDLQNLILSNIQIDNKLIPLQFSVLEKIKHNNFVFVFDEVGCGKTIEAGIVAFDTIKYGGKNILIVAPSNLSFNWYNEMISKFGLDFKIIGGTKDSIDLYYKKDNCYLANEYNIEKISNLCIVSYDSRKTDNSNAALDRLLQYNIKWDLVILDEGHESKNESSNRFKTLEKFKSDKVIFLSATPIKNIQEDFEKELELVKKILNNNNVEVKFSSSEFSADKVINFDLRYPISRNFKEILMDLGDFKTRRIEDISYNIDENIKKIISCKYDGMELDSKRGCVFLYDRIFFESKDLIETYSSYKKSKLEDLDYISLRKFDLKIDQLLRKIKTIFDENKENRVVIFCKHREVVDYLKKMLIFEYGDRYVESIHGESYSKEERKNRIFLLDKNDSEMNLKKIVILSHNIGSVGINLSKFSHIINYELPYTPADLEQRFGRIDRITNKNKFLTMYFFTDENKFFDEIYLQRIVNKMVLEVLPLIPSKNILFLSKRTMELYKEIVMTFINMNKIIKGNIEKTNMSELISIKKELLNLMEITIVDKDNELKIYDNKQSKELNILQLKNQMEVTLQNIFINIGISDVEKVEEEIDKFVTLTDNKIIFIEGTKQIRLDFNELKSKTYNEWYSKIEESTKKIDEEIKEISEKIINIYTSNNDEFKLDKVVDFIIDQISFQNINQNIIFSSLYSTWRVLNEHDKEISFEKIVENFNDRSF